MHGVDLGQVAAEGSARAHLDAPDRLHGARGLCEGRVARRFAPILGCANGVGRAACRDFLFRARGDVREVKKRDSKWKQISRGTQHLNTNFLRLNY